MVHSPDPENSAGEDNLASEPSSGRGCRGCLLRLSLFLIVLLSVVGVGGTIAVRWFVYNRLAPLVANQLENLINRPLEVGEVEGFSLSHLQLGESSLPATAEDQDTATVEAIAVRFNLLELITDRTLTLNLALENPRIFLDQTEDGSWVGLELNLPDEEGPISIEFDQIQATGGSIILQPFPWDTLTSEEEPTASGSARSGQLVRSNESPSEALTVPASQFLHNLPDQALPTALQPALYQAQQAQLHQFVIQDLAVDAELSNGNQFIAFDITGQPDNSGDFVITGEANIAEDLLNIAVRASDLHVADIGPLVRSPLTFESGVIDCNLDGQLNLRDLLDFEIGGTLTLGELLVQIDQVPDPISDITGQLRFSGQRVFLENVGGQYGELAAFVGGSVDLQEGFDVSVQVPTVSIAQVLNTLDVEAPIPASGEFRANLQVTGELTDPQVSGLVNNLTPVQVDQVRLADVGTEFDLTPELVRVTEVLVRPEVGGEILGSGTVALGDTGGLVFNFDVQNLPADAIAQLYGATFTDNLTVGPVNATAQVFGPLTDPNAIQAVVNWNALGGTYPAQGRVAYANDIVRAQDVQVQVAGGVVNAGAEVSLGDRLWRAVVNVADVPLNPFSELLSGTLTAEIGAGGSLDDLSPQGIEADGVVFFSEGIYLLNRALAARFNWQGDRLELVQAAADGFSASGFVRPQLEGETAPNIAEIDLDVELLNFALTPINDFLPPTVQQQASIAGAVSFDGSITGSGVDPRVAGSLWLDNLAVNTFTFDPVLSGSVEASLTQGVDVDLQGQQDRIAVQLDEQFLPVSLNLQVDEAIATGERDNDLFVGSIQNIDLDQFNYNPLPEFPLGNIGGEIDATYTANIADLNNITARADFNIINLGLGYRRFQTFNGRVFYSDGIVTLNQGELTFGHPPVGAPDRDRGTSRYLVGGRFDPTAFNAPGDTPILQAEILAAEGNVEDILELAQVFDLDDFGSILDPPDYVTASDVDPTDLRMSGLSIMNRIRRLAEIEARQTLQDQREEESLIPPLADVQGQFSGEISLEYYRESGLDANFNLGGDNLRWGDYGVDYFALIGEVRDNVIALLPLRLESGDAFINLTGQIGGDQQSAQLVARNVPVEALREIVDLPIDLAGDVNATAQLSGSIDVPQASGAIVLENGSLNQNPIDEAELRFNYNQARLNFLGEMLVSGLEEEPDDEPNPLTLSGSIPYALPFMSIQPNSEDLQLEVNVSDDGIALMNLFTNGLVTWEAGTGSVELDITGTLSNPQALGMIVLNDAIFAAEALPDALTNVNSRIQFDRDIIQVQEFVGDFGEGQILAQGKLPIAIPFSIPMPTSDIPDAEIPNAEISNADDGETLPRLSPDGPLTIALQDLAVELPEGPYSGGVGGQILLTGTALSPRIGGQLIVSNGVVTLPETPPSDADATNDSLATGQGLAPPEFNNLEVRLADDLRIVRSQPEIEFEATGDLVINGPINALSPRGVVQLERGYVNVVTTQFNLARRNRDFSQTATFFGGFDPFLNVRLVAIIPEVTRPPTFSTASPFATSEVADPSRTVSDLGSVQTVRVQAAVVGTASQLLNSLELSSTPNRSQNEIIALLGGGTLSALEQGNSTLAIANLAGSALLNNIQNRISRTLGLSEFRLFPTQVTSESTESSTLGLAAEVGFDITDQLSASVLQVLTADEPTQFGLRYRINDNLSVRGAANIEGDGQIILEYRSRF